MELAKLLFKILLIEILANKLQIRNAQFSMQEFPKVRKVANQKTLKSLPQ
jgi:hypothetical protein